MTVFSIETDINIVDEVLPSIKIAELQAISDVASFLLSEMDWAFEMEGPGWPPLSSLTIAKKQLRGAPEPERILKEWGWLRDSLAVNDESTGDKLRFGVGVFDYWFTGLWKPPVNASGRIIRDLISNDVPMVAGGSSLDWRRVSRAYIHEMGGFELQKDDPEGEEETGSKWTAKMEEIITRRLHHAALMGKAFIGNDSNWEALKRTVSVVKNDTRSRENKEDERKTQIVYIPRRSFIGDPFDRNVGEMLDILETEIADAIDNLGK